MRITSIAAAMPVERFDNAAVLGAIRGRATEIGIGEAEKLVLEARTDELFRRAGSHHRYLLSPPRRGSAIELVKQAATQALAEASLLPEDIDLIIYCSVARGWLEPSSAAAVQAILGASNASCFDVLEACAGWMRAVEVASALLQAGRYHNALIVGVEMGMHDVILPPEPGTTVGDEHLAGFTLGEAATAMIVEPHLDAPEIEIRSEGTLYDACMIPLPTIEVFLPDDGRPIPESGRFLSHLDRLFSTVITRGVELVRSRFAEEGFDKIDLFIPHGASAKASDLVRRTLNIPKHKWLCGHREFGNTVSMSMPVALRHGIETGRVTRGSRICFLVGSAGVSYGYGILTY